MKNLSALLMAAVLAVILSWAAAAGVEAASEKSLFETAEKHRQAFLEDKKAMGLRHKWLAVIERYQLTVNRFPDGKKTEEALMTLGDLYYGLYRRSRRGSDLDDAIENYRRVARRYPNSKRAPRAQLLVGELYLKYKDDPDRAYVELLKVELNHPKSGEVEEARKLMAKISDSAQGARADRAAAAASPESGSKALVKGLRYWSNPNYSRVALDVDQETTFQDHLLRQDPALGKPMRLYLDLPQARIAPNVKEELVISDGLLNRARVGQHDANTVRVVLDIQHISNYRIFTLNNPFRIVVDVMGDQKSPPPQETARAEDAKEPDKPLSDLRSIAKKRKRVPRGPAANLPSTASLARQLGLGIRKVVIDPGHGGKDHGATGITGLREKDLTLSVAKVLAKKIRKELGLEVVLTREKDVFLPLEERTAKANTLGADLFISVHANAHPSSSVHGIETYFLNLATDKEAMRVAAMENAATKKRMSDLQVILGDLMLNSKISESGRLGFQVQKAVIDKLKKKYRGLRNLGVKQAPFYVLIGANMPSILIELGFISNKAEEKRLRDKTYIDRLTDGIVDGIRKYNDSFKKTG